MFLRFIWCGLTLLCALAAIPVAADTAPAVHQGVLVITADNLSYPFIGQLFGAFKATLQQRKTPVLLYTESLDLAAFAGADRQALAAQWYLAKYSGRQLDAVVLVGHAALQFWMTEGLRPDTPAYFVVASETAVKAMRLPPNVTGQMMRIDLAQTVRLAKSLFPDTTAVALVGNVAQRDAYRPFGVAELQAVSADISMLDLRGMRYESLLQRLATLPAHTVIYHTTLSDDGSGRVFEPRRALLDTLRVANRPTLVDNGSTMGTGVLGGVMVDPAREGREAALRVGAVLDGAAAASMPMLSNTSVKQFDWRAMQRWQLADTSVPRGSELLFYSPPAWQQYRWQIAVTVLVLAALSALTIALLVERRRRALAVEQSRQRLAELAHLNRNATAGVFSAAIAHELNQPLAAILSNADAAELMLDMVPLPLDELRETLADIRRDDARASELIVRMRGLLKPSPVHSLVTDVNELIRQSLRFIAGEARLRGTTLTVSMAPQAAWVLADPVQIQQVLINLVVNSLDAVDGLPPAANRITIASAVLDAQRVEVAVRDNGSGFSGDIERVFDSFFTTKAHGMGLGLSITAAIIASHGGVIIAENQRGGGACVRFTLSLKEAP